MWKLKLAIDVQLLGIGDDVNYLEDIDRSKLPQFSITVSNSVFFLPPESYLVSSTSCNPDGLARYYSTFKYLLNAAKPVSEMWVLGSSFLKEHYTIYDYAQKTVCLANAVQEDDFEADVEELSDPEEEELR